MGHDDDDDSEDQKQSTSSKSISEGLIPNIEYQPLSQIGITRSRISLFNEDDSSDAAKTQEYSSENIVDANLNIPIITNQ